MANIDDYSDLIDEASTEQAEGANKYAETVNEMTDFQAKNVQSSVYLAQPADPDRQAKVMKLANRAGLAPEIVERNYDRINQEIETASTDYDEMIKTNPKVATWLEDIDNAKLSKDDIPALRQVEDKVKDTSFTGDIMGAFASGSLKLLSGLVKFQGVRGLEADMPPGFEDFTPSAGKVFDADQFENQTGVKIDSGLYDNTFTRYLDNTAKGFAPPEMSGDIIDEALGGNLSKATRIMALQVVSNLPQLGLIAATRGAGLPILFASGAGNKMAENVEAGVPTNVARVNAVASAAIETGIESLGGVGGAGFKTSIKEIVKNLGPETTLEVIKGSLKHIGKTSAEEFAEEFVTSVSQDILDYGMDVNKDGLNGIWQRALNAGIVGAGSGGTTAGIMTSAEGAMKVYQGRVKTFNDIDTYKEVGDAVKSTKLNERMSEKNKEFVKQAVEGTPIQEMYMDLEGFETYFQKKGISPAQGATELGLQEQYNKAKEAGADIQVNYGEWVGNSVNTEHYNGLQDDIKFDPLGSTKNQLATQEKAAREELTTANEETLAQPKAMNPSQVRTERSKALTETKAQLQDDLVNAGLDSREARVQSMVLGEAIGSLADAAGLTPQQVREQFPLNIRPGTAPVAGAMNQSDARMVRAREQGFNTEATYYHGTNEDFQSFDNEKAKRSYWGRGTYLSEDQGEAGTYGKKVLNTYIRSKNQFDVLRDNPPSTITDWMKSNFPKEHRELVKAVGEDGMAYNYLDAAKNVIPPDTLTQLLQEAGYDSLKMGEIINVFDPTNIKSTDAIFAESESGNIYSQQGDETQGQIVFKPTNETFESIILLFKAKNQSTFAHESAHYLFNVMGNLAARPESSQRLKEDYKGLLDFVGVESADQLTEAHQEKIARAWESYLMEGKAPTKVLKRAFSNFKTWLTAIYKSVQGLENASGQSLGLTDEVRSIFDRMLMSQEQIDLANLRMNYDPLFSLAGVSTNATEGQRSLAQKYVDAVADARVAADNDLREQLMETERRKATKFYKDERAGVESVVTQQMNAMPVYQAHSIITKGVMADGSPLAEGVQQIKISRKSVVNSYGEDVARMFPRGMFSPDGADVNTVSETYGFESTAEFVDQFSSFIPKNENIQATVNAEMESRYPDMMADPMITEDAVRAAHNADRDKIYRMEMDFLQEQAPGVYNDAIKRITRKSPSDKVMKAQALAIIGSQKISEIRPSVYERAEAKHNKASGELFVKGDILGALESKRKAALNNYLYKAAMEAKDNVEKDVQNFKKLFRKDSDLAKSRDVDLVNAARAVLSNFGITRSEKTADEYLQAVAKYDPDQYQNLKVLVDSAIQGAVPYKETTYDQFTDMSNAVKALWDLSKSNREIEINGVKLELGTSINSLIKTMSEVRTKEKKPEYEGSMTGWETFSGWIAGWRASARVVEHWAIAMGGDFKKIIFDPIQQGATAYRVEKNQKLREYVQTFKMLDYKSLNSGEIKADELGTGIKFKNKSEVLGAILHTGNESNFRKLLVGRGYGSINELDGTLDTARWDAFRDRLIRTGVLTKQDFDWAQAVWDLNETMKVGAWKAHKKMYGFYPNEITANEFTVVLDTGPGGLSGTPITYRGGYVPAIADPTRNEKAAKQDEKASMEMTAQNSFMFPTTGRGFTKGRVESYTVPLSLDINQVAGHLDKVLRFTHIEPNVKFVNRLIENQDFIDELATVDKAARKSMLTPWLQRSASQRMSTPMGTDSAWSGVDKVVSIVRARAGMQIMGGNVVNALQNYTGLSVAMVLVKPRHMRNALWDYTRNSTVVTETISEKSDFMKVLLQSDTRELMGELDHIITTPTAFQKTREWMTKNAYLLQKISQDQVSAITWQAAYDQSIENGMNDVQAVEEADSIVRQTQSNMTPEGSSRLVAGPPVMQLFVQFFGYFNNLANLNETQFKKIIKESGLRKGAGKLFMLFFLGTYMPALLSDVIRRAANGAGFDEDDDDQYMDDFISMFLGAPSSFLTAQIPFAGQISNVFVNQFNDKRYDDRLNISPAISMVENMVHSPGDVYGAVTKKSQERQGIRNTMNVIGIMTGLPGGALARPLTYLNDVRNGDAKPSGPIDFTRGVVTGKAGTN